MNRLWPMWLVVTIAAAAWVVGAFFAWMDEPIAATVWLVMAFVWSHNAIEQWRM